MPGKVATAPGITSKIRGCRAWVHGVGPGTAIAVLSGVRDPMMPTDAELMRELERAELRRLEQPQPQVRIRRASAAKPTR